MEAVVTEKCDNNQESSRNDIKYILLKVGFQRHFLDQIMGKMDDPSVVKVCDLFEGISFKEFIISNVFTERAMSSNFKQIAPKDLCRWLKKKLVFYIVNDLEEERGERFPNEIIFGSDPALLKSKYQTELADADFRILRECKKKLNLHWYDVSWLLLGERTDKYIKTMKRHIGYTNP